MRKIFNWLLKRYSKTEKDRIYILKTLDDKVSDTYPEQTVYGNVYNYHIEFVMANPFIVKCVKEKDTDSLRKLKSGLSTAFDEATNFIEKEM